MNTQAVRRAEARRLSRHRRSFRAPGDGINVAKTLHRIEESTLRQEIEAAGFKLASEADFLRHPEDPRDAGVFRPQVPIDEFVLKYQKPL